MDWLLEPAIAIGGSTVSRLELLGAVTGLLSVWWAAHERVWTWPIGIVNSTLFLLLFLDAGLYATAALQLAFITLGVYGWATWKRGDGDRAELAVRRTRRAEWLGLAAVAVIGQAAWTAWLVATTDSTVVFWDAAVLVLSLVATFGQARKLVESWWVWITVDVISIPLFLSQELVVTAALYGVFLVLCTVGLRDWTRSMRATAEAAPTSDATEPTGTAATAGTTATAAEPAVGPFGDPTVRTGRAAGDPSPMRPGPTAGAPPNDLPAAAARPAAVPRPQGTDPS